MKRKKYFGASFGAQSIQFVKKNNARSGDARAVED
jgi:hypothetical protein